MLLREKKKTKRKKNVKWLIGQIDKNWPELKKIGSNHLATVGAYQKNSKFKITYEFNVVKVIGLVLNAIKANCKNGLLFQQIKKKKFQK